MAFLKSVINSLSKGPAYIPGPQSPCPADSGASTYGLCTVYHILHVLPAPPVFWVQSPAVGALPNYGARSFLGFRAICAYCLFAYLLPSSAWISVPWAAKPGFFLTSFLQLWGSAHLHSVPNL